MHPYESPQRIDDGKVVKSWPRVIDCLCWLYPICVAATAIGTTMFLKASSLSVGPMQYDFYYENAGQWQQFWYSITLLLLVMSPVAVLFCPWLQLVWPFRPISQRFKYVGVTAAAWLAASLLIAMAGVPIVDYLID